jgi:hypothetical protein
MKTPHRLPVLAAVLACAGFLAAACGGNDGHEPTSATTVAVEPPSAMAQSSTAALAAYSSYWRLTTAAFADPDGRDWAAEFGAVARGQALESVLADVANYASLPAHTEGDIARSPAVDTALPGRVTVVDCIDLGNSRLVHDVTGETLDDLENRTQRYRFRAQVVHDDNGSWLVEQTTPLPDQPC